MSAIEISQPTNKSSSVQIAEAYPVIEASPYPTSFDWALIIQALSAALSSDHFAVSSSSTYLVVSQLRVCRCCLLQLHSFLTTFTNGLNDPAMWSYASCCMTVISSSCLVTGKRR